MTETIRFIHAADLHLDSPFKGLAEVPETIFSDIRNSTFHAFDQLVNLAIEQRVDFVLLVGDLFDNEKQSLRAQVHLRDGFEKLRLANINVYLSYGNHDFIKGNIHAITYPDNVFVFQSEQVTTFTYEKNEQELAQIYGFSYENRAVLNDKTDEYMLDNQNIPFHIGLLHGTLYGNKEHNPYAPFKLSNLQNKRFDYWALGHIHKRDVLSMEPPIVYSGNTQGRHQQELGEKGCYIVSLSKTTVDLEFVPLQSILFQQLTIDLTNCQSIHEIEPLILEKVKKEQSAQLIHIEFTGQTKKLYEWEKAAMFTEMIEIMNESFSYYSPWIYIYRYMIKEQEQSHIQIDDFFLDEYIRAVDHLNIKDVMQPLLHHREARKYVDLFTEEKQREIKERAKQLIVNELYQGRE